MMLEWDDANVEHISRHNVSPAEVEFVCNGLNYIIRGRFGRYLVFGQTGSGRYLKIILEHRVESSFRPVSAWEMSDSEKKNYRKKV